MHQEMRQHLYRKTCEGKIPHKTEQKALLKLARSTDKNMAAYECQFCGQWHLGHQKKHENKQPRNRPKR